MLKNSKNQSTNYVCVCHIQNYTLVTNYTTLLCLASRHCQSREMMNGCICNFVNMAYVSLLCNYIFVLPLFFQEEKKGGGNAAVADLPHHPLPAHHHRLRLHRHLHRHLRVLHGHPAKVAAALAVVVSVH